MDLLPDWWNDLVEWFMRREPNSLSMQMRKARLVWRFCNEVNSGGIADLLWYQQSEFPHVELTNSIIEVCGHPYEHLIKEAVSLYACGTAAGDASWRALDRRFFERNDEPYHRVAEYSERFRQEWQAQA